jgi:hypothetical protein
VTRHLPVLTRPRTRADCQPGGPNAARPCPFVGCRYHTAIDVTEHGSIRSRAVGTLSSRAGAAEVDAFGDQVVAELERMKYTCSLDVADLGPSDVASQLYGREPARLIANRATDRLASIMRGQGVTAGDLETDPSPDSPGGTRGLGDPSRMP